MDNEQHHWTGVKPDPKNHWGFIYCVTHLPTGKKYIGKKAYRASAGKAKRRCMSVDLPAFKEWHWKENNWRWYSGSSKYLNEFKKGTKDSEWEHEILTQCTNSMDLHYQEIEYLVWNQVLTLVDDEGEYVFFNRSIPGIRFRPPTNHTEASKAKMSESGTRARTGLKRGEYNVSPTCIKCGGDDWYYHRASRTNRRDEGVEVINRRCRTCKNECDRKRKAEQKEAKQ
jgi:hypothetical protein